MPLSEKPHSSGFGESTHVVINGYDEAGRLECLHCGFAYQPQLPLELMAYAKLLETFVDKHKDCELLEIGRIGPAKKPSEVGL